MAVGEMISPHFQLPTAGKSDEAKWWKTSFVTYMHDIRQKFGYDDSTYFPCTFSMNEKGRMNREKFEKYIMNIIAVLFPDVADIPISYFLIKVDSWPGRDNMDLMALLRLREF